VICTWTRFLTCSSISKKNPHSSAHRVTPRPRRKIPPPTSSDSAAAPSAEAEPLERHPAARCPAPSPGPGACHRAELRAWPRGEPRRGRSSVEPLPPPRARLLPLPPTAESRDCWLLQSPPGRLWSLVTPCFICFRRFKLIFQVFIWTFQK